MTPRRSRGAAEARAPVGDEARRARAALKATGEILILHQPAYTGGLKEWFLVRDWDSFERVMGRQRFRSAFTVFLKPDLPIRGPASSILEDHALSLLEQRGELLLCELAKDGSIKDAYCTDEAEDVCAFLQERLEHPMAVGPIPPFWLQDSEDQYTVYVPESDGVIIPGSY